MAGVALAVPLAARIGKKGAFAAAMGAAAVLSLFFFRLEPSELGWLFALQALVSVAAGVVLPLLWSMYADIVDYEEYRSGRRLRSVGCGAERRGDSGRTANDELVSGRRMLVGRSGSPFLPARRETYGANNDGTQPPSENERMMEKMLVQWREELSEELTCDILPFWMTGCISRDVSTAAEKRIPKPGRAQS